MILLLQLCMMLSQLLPLEDPSLTSSYVNMIKSNFYCMKSRQLDNPLVSMISREYRRLGVAENAEFGRFVQMLCPRYHISHLEDTNRLIPTSLWIMATSIPYEIIFSNAGQILCDKWSRLKCSILSMILFLNAKLEYDCRLTYTQTHSMGS